MVNPGKHMNGLEDSTWVIVALGDSTPTGYGLDSGLSYVYIYAR
jgi:hypothetical protein